MPTRQSLQIDPCRNEQLVIDKVAGMTPIRKGILQQLVLNNIHCLCKKEKEGREDEERQRRGKRKEASRGQGEEDKDEAKKPRFLDSYLKHVQNLKEDHFLLHMALKCTLKTSLFRAEMFGR